MQGRGSTRACADDIGAVIREKAHLCLFRHIFSIAEASAGLCLKPSKCWMVPLAAEFSHSIESSMRQWLKATIPEWSDFQIGGKLKMLGLYLGPEACPEHSYAAPLAKYKARIHAVAASHLPPSVATLQYMVWCLSCISYVAQFFGPLNDFLVLECWAINKLLHLPPSSLSVAAGLQLKSIGMIDLKSLTATATASLARAAAKTLQWSRHWNDLTSFAELELPL
eukprot:7933020-Lingulodinium_polyedra.AAC.1